MRKAEIDRKFDEIVAFAEVGTVHRHAGEALFERHVRAAGLRGRGPPGARDPDRRRGAGGRRRRVPAKCLGKMGDVASEGRTVLFVSHNMAAITRLCQRALWLDEGQVQAYGDTEEVVAQYLTAGVRKLGRSVFPRPRRGGAGDGGGAPARGAHAERSRGDSRRRWTRGTRSRSRSSTGAAGVASLRVGFRLTAHDGVGVLSSTDVDGSGRGAGAPPGHLPEPLHHARGFLNYGQYFLSVGSDPPMIHGHFLVDRALAVHVEHTGCIGADICMGARAAPRRTARLPGLCAAGEAMGTAAGSPGRSGADRVAHFTKMVHCPHAGALDDDIGGPTPYLEQRRETLTSTAGLGPTAGHPRH